MGTKTISLSDDAYEKLKAEKKEGESFSDVVRRLTSKNISLRDFHGILSEGSAEEIREVVQKRRQDRQEIREQRRENLVERLGK
ncbi:antitoxin VapB family protein [Halorutilales archaeon Cl-col2-1]